MGESTQSFPAAVGNIRPAADYTAAVVAVAEDACRAVDFERAVDDLRPGEEVRAQPVH